MCDRQDPLGGLQPCLDRARSQTALGDVYGGKGAFSSSIPRAVRIPDIG
jgi:hypothetical protein